MFLDTFVVFPRKFDCHTIKVSSPILTIVIRQNSKQNTFVVHTNPLASTRNPATVDPMNFPKNLVPDHKPDKQYITFFKIR